MDILQFVWFCFFVASAAGNDRGRGDVCQQDNGALGKCQLIYDCISGMSDFEHNIWPKICGFDDKIPIICCSERLNRISKSAAKCYEYARITLQSRFKANPNKEKKKRETNEYSLLPASGGVRSAIREFPHMAALGFGDKNNTKWMCGGTLISEEYVLTAAHCLFSTDLGEVKWVRLGDLNLYTNVDDARPQDFEIAQKIKHPGYIPPSRYNDIALLKLNRKVEFDDYILPACLHQDHNISTDILTATGWGLTEDYGEPSDHLIKVDLDVYSDEDCKELYKPEITLKKGVLLESQFCAGGKTSERGTCRGDSGGPIQMKTDNIDDLYTVVGITSFGKRCAVINTGSVFTRVSRYISWIENIVWPDKF